MLYAITRNEEGLHESRYIMSGADIVAGENSKKTVGIQHALEKITEEDLKDGFEGSFWSNDTYTISPLEKSGISSFLTGPAEVVDLEDPTLQLLLTNWSSFRAVNMYTDEPYPIAEKILLDNNLTEDECSYRDERLDELMSLGYDEDRLCELSLDGEYRMSDAMETLELCK